MTRVRAGVDVGGTFTDAVVIDEIGELSVAKVTSSPAKLDESVVTCLSKASARGLDQIGHGTTVATNVTLERSGPRVALLCTQGFRDMLEMGRLARPSHQLYGLKNVMPDPLVARRDCFEIAERMGPRGETLRALVDESVRQAAIVIRARGIDNIAVCFLHAYRNPSHERRVREILAEELPGARVSLSSDVGSEPREYERANTTVLNAYLRPAVDAYFDRLNSALREAHPRAPLWIMQSNGGLTSPTVAAATPVRLVMSGPAGGVVAAHWASEMAGLGDLVTIDMGGTSLDVSLIRNGTPQFTDQLQVLDLPLRGRAVDVLAVGAGGGSVAWIDPGGHFRVGPRSAGAFPGPASYGRGGDEPTVTDANLLLGYLSGDTSLGDSGLILDSGAAAAACTVLGRKLNLTLRETALGIRRIVNSTMAAGVASMTLRRGIDPRALAMLAYGGAGPLHAVAIAQELGIERVIVPPLPGVFSALGICVSDVAQDFFAPLGISASPENCDLIARELAALQRAADARLTELGVPASRRHFQRSFDMRYRGQNFALEVPADDGRKITQIRRRFDRLHYQLYGFGSAEQRVEVCSVRLRAIGRFPRPAATVRAQGEASPGAPCDHAEVLWGEGSSTVVPTAIYERESLGVGTRLVGPALIRSRDSTAAVPPSWSGEVDTYFNLLLRPSGHA